MFPSATAVAGLPEISCTRNIGGDVYSCPDMGCRSASQLSPSLLARTGANTIAAVSGTVNASIGATQVRNIAMWSCMTTGTGALTEILTRFRTRPMTRMCGLYPRATIEDVPAQTRAVGQPRAKAQPKVRPKSVSEKSRQKHESGKDQGQTTLKSV